MVDQFLTQLNTDLVHYREATAAACIDWPGTVEGRKKGAVEGKHSISSLAVTLETLDQGLFVDQYNVDKFVLRLSNLRSRAGYVLHGFQTRI